MLSALPRLNGRRLACETERKLALPCRAKIGSTLLALLFVVWAAGAAALGAAAQPEHARPATAEIAKGEGAHEGRGMIDVIARAVNFAILAGALAYLLRPPIRVYLSDRSAQIRSDLVNAADMKASAAAQIEEIDRKMRALPGELEALRKAGAEEISAEEVRIRAAAVAERDRLLEQARREIDLQVKLAERALVGHAADLAVGVATERIKKTITDEDQTRLVDRYVQQLRA